MTLKELVRALEIDSNIPLRIELCTSTNSKSYLRILKELKKDDFLMSLQVVAILPHSTYWFITIKKG